MNEEGDEDEEVELREHGGGEGRERGGFTARTWRRGRTRTRTKRLNFENLGMEMDENEEVELRKPGGGKGG